MVAVAVGGDKAVAGGVADEAGFDAEDASNAEELIGVFNGAGDGDGVCSFADDVGENGAVHEFLAEEGEGAGRGGGGFGEAAGVGANCVIGDAPVGEALSGVGAVVF